MRRIFLTARTYEECSGELDSALAPLETEPCMDSYSIARPGHAHSNLVPSEPHCVFAHAVRKTGAQTKIQSQS